MFDLNLARMWAISKSQENAETVIKLEVKDQKALDEIRKVIPLEQDTKTPRSILALFGFPIYLDDSIPRDEIRMVYKKRSQLFSRTLKLKN